MLDPIVNFFIRTFQWIGRGSGLVVGAILWPFLWAARWYRQRGWILRAVIGLLLLGLVLLYGYFIWSTQRWNNFDPLYAEAYNFTQPATSTQVETAAPAGAAETAEGEVKTCTVSAITQVAADLIDFNVDENAWVSSMILYKLGFFGLDWDETPFLDNKASFQRGINQAVRRTAIELVDT